MQVIITAKMMAIKLYTAIFVSILGAENEKKKQTPKKCGITHENEMSIEDADAVFNCAHFFCSKKKPQKVLK